MATEFEMSFKGSTKELLDAISILAEHNINLNTVATAKVDGRYVVKFHAGNEEEVRRMLMKADLQFKDQRVLVVSVFNRPGQWLRVARTLVENGVDINASYLLGQRGDTMSIVFVVSDYDKARNICSRLGECSID